MPKGLVLNPETYNFNPDYAIENKGLFLQANPNA